MHHFFRSLNMRFPSAKRQLPITSLIVDSAPGTGSVKGFAEFILVSLRLRRTLFSVLATTLLSAILTSVMRITRGIWGFVFGYRRQGRKWGVHDDIFEEIADSLGNGAPRFGRSLGGGEWAERCGKLFIYSEVGLRRG